MNTKHQRFADDEIDLRKVILILWKEKFIILIITLIFTVTGYIYNTLQPKDYQITVTLRNAPVALFEKYRPYIQQEEQLQRQQQQQISIATNFNEEFKLNLMSHDNLSNFVEQNKKLDEFKSYKLQPMTDNKNSKPNQYSFTLSKPLPAEKFLIDYIFYIKQITVNSFKKQLKLTIENELEIYKQNLEIAKKIDLENPILKSFAEGNSVVNEPSALFYKGSKVLSQQIVYQEKLLDGIETFVFEYNPILESPTKPSLVSKSVTGIIYNAFALGLSLSLIFIFLRSLLSK